MENGGVRERSRSVLFFVSDPGVSLLDELLRTFLSDMGLMADVNGIGTQQVDRSVLPLDRLYTLLTTNRNQREWYSRVFLLFTETVQPDALRALEFIEMPIIEAFQVYSDGAYQKIFPLASGDRCLI